MSHKIILEKPQPVNLRFIFKFLAVQLLTNTCLYEQPPHITKVNHRLWFDTLNWPTLHLLSGFYIIFTRHVPPKADALKTHFNSPLELEIFRRN